MRTVRAQIGAGHSERSGDVHRRQLSVRARSRPGGDGGCGPKGPRDYRGHRRRRRGPSGYGRLPPAVERLFREALQCYNADCYNAFASMCRRTVQTATADLGSNARLGQPEINIGYIPPVGATQALARLIGRPRALKYLYDGTLVSAKEALAIGLIDEIYPAEELHNKVQAYAESLAQKPANALAAIRRTITKGGGMSFDDGLKLEFETAVNLAGTKDFSEGIKAFLEKRNPDWD